MLTLVYVNGFHMKIEDHSLQMFCRRSSKKGTKMIFLGFGKRKKALDIEIIAGVILTQNKEKFLTLIIQVIKLPPKYCLGFLLLKEKIW